MLTWCRLCFEFSHYANQLVDEADKVKWIEKGFTFSRGPNAGVDMPAFQSSLSEPLSPSSSTLLTTKKTTDDDDEDMPSYLRHLASASGMAPEDESKKKKPSSSSSEFASRRSQSTSALIATHSSDSSSSPSSSSTSSLLSSSGWCQWSLSSIYSSALQPQVRSSGNECVLESLNLSNMQLTDR